MNPLIFTNLKVAAVGVLIGLCLIFYTLWQRSDNALEKYKIEADKAVAVQKAKFDLAQADYKQTTEETQNDYEKRIADLRAYYAARRVLPARGNSSPMPGISQPPASIDAIPADALPLAEQCAETTQQLISLQDWINQVIETNHLLSK